MRNRLIVHFLRQLYHEFLRDMIVKYVKESETGADDVIVPILDVMLGFVSPLRKGEKHG